MESHKERAQLYLTDWLKIMQSENPLTRITRYAGGAKENESMVVHHLKVLQQSIIDQAPDVKHMLYTNCKDVDGWAGSFVFDTNEVPADSGHTYQKGVHSAVIGYMEEGYMADVYVTNGLPPVMALYGLGLGYFNLPIPPVVSVMAKSPEGLWDYVTDFHAVSFLRYLGNIDTFWVCVLDSANEEALMCDLLQKAGISNFDRVRRVRTFSFDKKKFPQDKQDVVVWSGRDSSMKNPALGIQVSALLPKVQKEVFFPRPSPGAGRKFNNIDKTIVHAGEPPDVYRSLTRSAKAILVTSHAEGFPVGFIELWCQGVIPVIWDRPWNSDLLPEDYPFRFKTAGEAAEMVLEVLKNYDQYAPDLYKWCVERFAHPINFPEIIGEIWKDYTLKLGDRIRLVSKRGARKSL